jgi:chromodomain-helicase-DNA-binding protein 4
VRDYPTDYSSASSTELSTHAMSTDEDSADIMASFKKGTLAQGNKKNPLQTPKQASLSTGDYVSEQSLGGDERATQTSPANVRKLVAVKPLPVRDRDQYTYYEPKETVESIIREFQQKGDLMYKVKLTDGVTKQVRLTT